MRRHFSFTALRPRENRDSDRPFATARLRDVRAPDRGRTICTRADLRREGTQVRFQVRGVIGPRAAVYACGAILARAAVCLSYPFEIDRVRHAREDPTAVLPRQLRYPLKFRCDVSPSAVSRTSFSSPVLLPGRPFPSTESLRASVPRLDRSYGRLRLLHRLRAPLRYPFARRYPRVARSSLLTAREHFARRARGLIRGSPTDNFVGAMQVSQVPGGPLPTCTCSADPGGAVASWSSTPLVSPSALKTASASSCPTFRG